VRLRLLLCAGLLLPGDRMEAAFPGDSNARSHSTTSVFLRSRTRQARSVAPILPALEGTAVYHSEESQGLPAGFL
jgi:hypothetical protein